MYTITDRYFEGDDLEFDTYDDAIEFCHEQQITYYTHAMEYLTENDPSLEVSMGLALEMGFDKVGGLNSELLATLVLQSRLIGSIEKVCKRCSKKS